jgi:hypothetical protein
MNALEKIQSEFKVLREEESSIIEKLKSFDEQKKILKGRLQEMQTDLFEKGVYTCYITEIFRIAKIQFSRLNKRVNEELIPVDTLELNKWIGRVKSEQGLRDIIDALKELAKYKPGQVKNIYALTQRIIIGGAYKKSPHKK